MPGGKIYSLKSVALAVDYQVSSGVGWCPVSNPGAVPDDHTSNMGKTKKQCD